MTDAPIHARCAAECTHIRRKEWWIEFMLVYDVIKGVVDRVLPVRATLAIDPCIVSDKFSASFRDH